MGSDVVPVAPRLVSMLNALLFACTIASFVFIGVGFPAGVYNCDGIVVGALLLAGFGISSHFLVFVYLIPALTRDTWPWDEAEELSPYDRMKAAANAARAPGAGDKAAAGGKQAGEVTGERDSLLPTSVQKPGGGYGTAGRSPEPAVSELRAVLEEEPAQADAAGQPAPTSACPRRCSWSLTARAALFSVCTLTVLAIYAFAIIAVWLRSTTLPDLEGSKNLAGLQAPVTLFRESSGIVHVYAANDADLFFSQGYAHAQLRLWQMEFQRRVGAGRLAEVAGSAALDIDKAMRTLAVYPAAQATFGVLANATQAALTAYTAGVNAYISAAAAGSEALPLEFKLLGYTPDAWDPADSLVWAKLMSYSLSGNMAKEVSRYRLATQQNLTTERINQLIPPFDTAHFPTVLSWSDISPPYGPTPPSDPLSAANPWEELVLRGRAVDVVPDPVAQALLAARAVEQRLFEGASDELQQQRRRLDAEFAPAAAATTTHASSGSGFGLGGLKFQRGHSGVPVLGLRSTGMGASNNWVLGPNFTAAHAPLLSNDPHLDFTAPMVWILMQLNSAASGLNVMGASFPGIPAIVLGHNDAIAWGVTNTGADVQDTYIMTGNASHYWYNGQYVPYAAHTQVIKVKGADDVVVTVRTSAYGNVVTDNGFITGVASALALRWISTDATIPDTTMDAFLNVNYASDWATFRAALAPYIAPSQNFVFADVAGNFGYQMSGYVPTRNVAAGYTGAWPSPGDGNATFVWGARIPYDQMPRTFNPPDGFVASANNQVTPPGYPLFITADWDGGSDGYRARRITDMVNASRAHTVGSMQAIQQDYTSQLAADYIAAITALTLQGLTPAGAAVRSNLAGFDTVMRVSSNTATLWAQVWRRLATLGAEETNTTYWGDMVWTLRAITSDASASPNGTDPACVRKGFPTCAAFVVWALNDVGGAYGVDASTASIPLWGSGVHQAQFSHQLLTGSPLECLSNRHVFHGGDDSTVNVGGFDMTDDALPQTAGPSFRQVADLSDLGGGSVFVMPMGEDGSLLSFNYDSLLSDWAFGAYAAMVNSRPTLLADAEITQSLYPKGGF